MVTDFYFDISTSARWSGEAVGIIRVERELGKRARLHLGSNVSFCVYDLATHKFWVVKDELVDQLLDGKATIDFEGRMPARRPTATLKMRRLLRDAVLETPGAYRIIQRFRGLQFSPNDVQKLRELRRSKRRDLLAKKKPPTPFEAATVGEATLTNNSVVISGGLDWEHKQVREIGRLKKSLNFKFISIIYDLIPIYLPHYVVPHYVDLLTAYFGELLWASDGCLCISETTKQDLARFCEDNAAPSLPSRVFPLGADAHKLEETDKLPLQLRDKRYALYVSTIEPRKNHRAAYEAWCHGLLTGKIDPIYHRLVFVGRQGWQVGDLVHEMSTNPLTRETIVILSGLSDESLATLYRKAAFTIFPSFYEGFGLPLAESLEYGKLCLTSGAGALKEVGTGLRLDIDPRDILTWSKTMSDLLRSSDKVDSYEKRIKDQYKAVSWDQSANAFYESLQSMVR